MIAILLLLSFSLYKQSLWIAMARLCISVILLPPTLALYVMVSDLDNVYKSLTLQVWKDSNLFSGLLRLYREPNPNAHDKRSISCIVYWSGNKGRH